VWRTRVDSFRVDWVILAKQTRDVLQEGRKRLDSRLAGLAGGAAASETDRARTLAEQMVTSVWNRETERFNEFAKDAARKVDSGSLQSKDRAAIVQCVGAATDQLNATRGALLREARGAFRQ